MTALPGRRTGPDHPARAADHGRLQRPGRRGGEHEHRLLRRTAQAAGRHGAPRQHRPPAPSKAIPEHSRRLSSPAPCRRQQRRAADGAAPAGWAYSARTTSGHSQAGRSGPAEAQWRVSAASAAAAAGSEFRQRGATTFAASPSSVFWVSCKRKSPTAEPTGECAECWRLSCDVRRAEVVMLQINLT